jgi:hypothetical protein
MVAPRSYADSATTGPVGLERGSKGCAERGNAATDPRFDGANGETLARGNLRVGEAVEEGALEGQALHVWKLVDRATNPSSLEESRRLGLGGLHRRHGFMCDSPVLDGSPALTAPQPIDAEVSHENHEPAGDGAALRHVLPGSIGDHDEDVVQDVLGLLSVAQDPQSQGKERRRIAIVEVSDEVDLAVCNAPKQQGIVLVAKRQVDWMMKRKVHMGTLRQRERNGCMTGVDTWKETLAA